MKMSIVPLLVLICCALTANAATEQDRENAKLRLQSASLDAQGMVLYKIQQAYYQNAPDPDHAGDALKLGFAQTKNEGRQVGRTSKVSCKNAGDDYSDGLYAEIQKAQAVARDAMTSDNQLATEEYIDMLEKWADIHSRLYLYACLSVRR